MIFSVKCSNTGLISNITKLKLWISRKWTGLSRIIIIVLESFSHTIITLKVIRIIRFQTWCWSSLPYTLSQIYPVNMQRYFQLDKCSQRIHIIIYNRIVFINISPQVFNNKVQMHLEIYLVEAKEVQKINVKEGFKIGPGVGLYFLVYLGISFYSDMPHNHTQLSKDLFQWRKYYSGWRRLRTAHLYPFQISVVQYSRVLLQYQRVLSHSQEIPEYLEYSNKRQRRLLGYLGPLGGRPVICMVFQTQNNGLSEA